MDDIDTLNNNRFELLSAYIDHEVSVVERKKIEKWLADDPEFYRLHQRLLMLQRSCQSIPTPSSSQTPVDQTIDRVFAQLDNRRRLPLWSTLIAAAVAATAGAIAGAWNSGGPFGAPQFADSQNRPDSSVMASFDTPTINVVPPQEAVEPSGLMIVLDRPPVDLPPTINVSDPGID